MSTPRLEINLSKIYDNASTLVNRMSSLGISVTGVTKVSLGSNQIAQAMLGAGVTAIGDSRIENLIAMDQAGIVAPMWLIRSPSLSQVETVVSNTSISFNTELMVLKSLSVAAAKQNLNHGVILMVELGDLREGIILDNVEDVVRQTLKLSNITIKGIGANLGCQSGTIPDIQNMAILSDLANKLESTFNLKLDIVSGGNSSNLMWAQSGADVGKINNLRLGESILLGRHPTSNEPIEGLFTNAFSFITEVIEAKIKPSQSWGPSGRATFAKNLRPKGEGLFPQIIFAAGHQDIDPSGLVPALNIKVLGASSDHLIVDGRSEGLTVGAEAVFHPNYAALLRAMTSPYVHKVYSHQK